MNALQLDVAARVATVTINRPAQRNAINYAMWAALPDLCARLDADPEVRVVIWTGAGHEAFSAGGDIGEFEEHRSNAAQTRAYNAVVESALDAVLALGKPTIAKVKGYCVGGGFILAAYCDLRIAAENALCGVPVARLGMPITYPQMQRFVHLIGASAILDLLLTARLLTAAEARESQLCSQVFPLDAIDDAVDRLAQQMTRLSPHTQRVHKQMLQSVLHTPDLSRLTPAEHALLDAGFDSPDYAEGVRAFLEKRTPRF